MDSLNTLEKVALIAEKNPQWIKVTVDSYVLNQSPSPVLYFKSLGKQEIRTMVLDEKTKENYYFELFQSAPIDLILDLFQTTYEPLNLAKLIKDDLYAGNSFLAYALYFHDYKLFCQLQKMGCSLRINPDDKKVTSAPEFILSNLKEAGNIGLLFGLSHNRYHQLINLNEQRIDKDGNLVGMFHNVVKHYGLFASQPQFISEFNSLFLILELILFFISWKLYNFFLPFNFTSINS